MFKYVKKPKNLCEYRLFRGAADFGNLQQWDLYETGYSFLTVVTVPDFISTLATTGTKSNPEIKNIASLLLNNFVYILEHEFRGLSGLPELSTQKTTITDGISELQLINKVEEDTSVQISMSFFEKAGRTLTKFCELYLRGIKDTRTQGKTYWGLVADGDYEPGFDKEVFSFLYYVTDNTYRTLEGSYLLMCAQIDGVPTSELFNTTKGTYQNPEIELRFNCFPITNDEVSYEAAALLEFLLSDDAGSDKLIVDTQSITDFYTGVKDIRKAYGLRASGADVSGANTYSASNSNAYTDNRNKYTTSVANNQKYKWS